MIFAAALAAAVASASAATDPKSAVAEATYAIAAGRLEQARILIGQAVARGADKPAVDSLLADFAFASGKNDEALIRYEQILKDAGAAPELCEKAATAALRIGELARAEPLVTCATADDRGSWRAWNARGALSDHYGDWAQADRAYQRAAQLAPDRPEILNNQGWSRLLRGDWQGALELLTKAEKLAPSSPRIVNNLELARVGVAAALPERRAGESALAWAHRLNDAGVAAQLLGNRQKAIAAFTRALEASEIWYARAANNLSKASETK